MTRGTSNKNVTGSAEDRRRRRAWLLVTFGDGVVAPCGFGCGTMVDMVTLTVDRHPLAGCEGGTYRRDNIRPACAPCNMSAGGKLGASRMARNRDR